MTSKSKPVIPEHILASSSCPLGEIDERIGLALADISACDKGSNPAQVIGVSHDEGIPRKARIPISRLSTAPHRVSTITSDTELPAWHTRWSQRNQVGTTKEPNDGRPGRRVSRDSILDNQPEIVGIKSTRLGLEMPARTADKVRRQEQQERAVSPDCRAYNYNTGLGLDRGADLDLMNSTICNGKGASRYAPDPQTIEDRC